jgi:hypothetical protein
MKTTLEIADPLLDEARRVAAERGTTLRAVVEEALMRHLADRSRPRKPFRLRDAAFRGRGLQPGLEWGDGDRMRALAYEGRGD